MNLNLNIEMRVVSLDINEMGVYGA